jgi:cobalt-zinc-cadmium resistance protein CzcA
MMVRRWIAAAVANPLLVMLVTAVLTVGGSYAFFHVNIEAYPDPAPAIVEVVAQFPGASAEEVERQVTIPLEVALAGMPGLETTRSKSLFGLSHIRNQFNYHKDFEQAKQDVINRLQNVDLPAGVKPVISPASPIGEILRFTLANPLNPATGKPVYTLNDLQALENFVIERSLRQVPGIAGVSGVGGTTKRYEIHPDPYLLERYGIPLSQLDSALSRANTNGSGDNLTQGQQTMVVRSLGLFGQGQDPQDRVLGMSDPVAAARVLRAEEARRCLEIRQVVVASVNNVPVRVDHIVDGGPVLNADGTPRVDDTTLVKRGVVVNHLTRQGRCGISKPHLGPDGKQEHNADGTPKWDDDDDVVQGIVLLKKGAESIPALEAVLARIDELNESGQLLPGVRIVPYYNRAVLIERTTETVHENLLVGMGLVTAVLLMFLSNVRAALIAAINIPLALLFAFSVLFVRGKSANLLSVGAVDFGIIADSTVIIVEAIYRHLSHGEGHGESLTDRIVQAASAVQRSMFFATIIMVCALLPLFTMKGPEGQIFGPMADTYAFALAGALLLAITVSPVLCVLLLGNLKPKPDNFMVRGLQSFFLGELHLLLRVRWVVLGVFVMVIGFTAAVAANMGREFMPELEEGGMLIRGTFPVNISLDEVTRRAHQFRQLVGNFGELRVIQTAVGRPDDGTDPTGYYNVEATIPLRPQHEWPIDPARGRCRTKAELVADLNVTLDQHFPGVDFDISQIIRDNVMEALSGVKGENSIKIFGPNLGTLETTAIQVRDTLGTITGVENPGVFRIQGQSNFEFPVDPQKCSHWAVTPADIQNVVQCAVGGKSVTTMQEGAKKFDVTLRWPERLRSDEQTILAIPVPVANNVTDGNRVAVGGTPVSGGASGLSATGTAMALPAATGNVFNAPALAPNCPSRRLGDLVTPLNLQGEYDPRGSFVRPGASTIYREQSQRFIAIKFEVRGRDLASAVAEAKAKVAPLIHSPYRTEWSGEFRQMEEAERRLTRMFAVSMALIILLIYMAFRSVLDACVVLANVAAMAVGGVWALKITNLHFNISAAVGFISILGVAVMHGLVFVSAFNGFRSRGIDLDETLERATRQRIRPILMTALTALLGLLPAALSNEIGSESQKPLAVVVVGGMLATIVCINLVPLWYSFYGHREPAEGAADLSH